MPCKNPSDVKVMCQAVKIVIGLCNKMVFLSAFLFNFAHSGTKENF